MRLNPEIRRNLWLEFSLQRILAMPVVLGLIFFVVSKNPTANVPLQGLVTPAALVFFLLVKIWGGHKAADAVIDEVNENTWDFQKLSALSPWSLTLGKLFGGTIYAWYGGLMALAAAFVASNATAPLYDTCVGTVLLLLSGLIVHATALFSSLLSVQRRTGARNKLRGFPHLLAGLVVGSLATASLGSYPSAPHTALQPGPGNIILWYGTAFDRLGFVTIATAIILAWLVAGIYWQMRGQMKMRTGPWLWVGFVIYWVAFISGFNMSAYSLMMITDFNLQDLAAFMAALGCLYAITFQETWNVVRYRRFASAWKDRNYHDIFEICPRWVLTFVICLAVVTGVSLSYKNPVGTVFMLAWLSFAARDIALLHVFKLSPGYRRPHQTTQIYLAVLYVLLPFLFSVFHSYRGMALFLPWPMQDNKAYVYQALISGLAQASLVTALAIARWRQYGERSD